MNFDYTDEQRALKASVRQMLERSSADKAVRHVINKDAQYDMNIWSDLGRQGWTLPNIPTEYGGLGIDYVSLCGIFEEFGRALLPIPLDSSHLGVEVILEAGREEVKRALLPQIAASSTIVTFAVIEEVGNVSATQIRSRCVDGLLSGHKVAVPNGLLADLAVVAARDEDGDISLYVVPLDESGVERHAVDGVDPTRPCAELTFQNARAEPLGSGKEAWESIRRALERVAILTAFEQLGGADRCLELARDYALERQVFGRPIGAYQAIKHKLADMFVANELGRSAAYFGAWALTAGVRLSEAAAVARISCTKAFEKSSREYIQVCGGIAITWEHDAHLFYRRSRHLALALGSTSEWSDRLITLLDEQRAA